MTGVVNGRTWEKHISDQALASEPCAAAGCSLQIHNGLSTAASLQLLHDQVGLDAQQQRLTGVRTASRCPSLKGLRLKQGLLTELVVTRFKAALGSGLKGSQGRGLGRRGHHAESQQDCDGAREQGSGGRFTEMMPQHRSHRRVHRLDRPCSAAVHCGASVDRGGDGDLFRDPEQPKSSPELRFSPPKLRPSAGSDS